MTNKQISRCHWCGFCILPSRPGTRQEPSAPIALTGRSIIQLELFRSALGEPSANIATLRAFNLMNGYPLGGGVIYKQGMSIQLGSPLSSIPPLQCTPYNVFTPMNCTGGMAWGGLCALYITTVCIIYYKNAPSNLNPMG